MIICRTIQRWAKALNNLVKIPIRKACNGYYLRWYYNGWHYWFFLPGDQQQETEGENYRTIGTLKITMSTGQITQQEAIGVKTILLTREVYILTTNGWRNIRIEPGTIQIYESETEGAEIEITASIGSRELSRTSGFSPVPIVPEVPPVPDPTICEVVIGTQVWMCYNYDAEFPGSKVYDNDEDNAALYGRLYSYAQVQDSGFAPAGWRVPTQADWIDLITYIGGYAGGGGELKEVGTDTWDAPNTGAVDTYGFAAKGAGAWFQWTGFTNLKKFGYFWCLSPAGFNYAYYCADDTAEIKLLPGVTPSDMSFAPFLSVRLIKTTPAPPIVYDDWFLPSYDEIQEIRNALVPAYIVADDWWWSSSEHSATEAYYIDFQFNVWNQAMKVGNDIGVLACRTFTAAVGEYSIGDTGVGGGWVFYINGTTYYEVYKTPLPLVDHYHWSNIALLVGTGTAIGTGAANTAAIIGQAGHTGSAAKLCDDLIVTI